MPNGLRCPEPVAVASKSQPLRIVCSGSIHAAKRQGDLVAALENLDAATSSWCSWARTSTWIRRSVPAIEAAPDRYRLVGQVSRAEAFSWTASADMLALVSDGENQPICLGRPTKAGVPVIIRTSTRTWRWLAPRRELPDAAGRQRRHAG